MYLSRASSSFVYYKHTFKWSVQYWITLATCYWYHFLFLWLTHSIVSFSITQQSDGPFLVLECAKHVYELSYLIWFIQFSTAVNFDLSNSSIFCCNIIGTKEKQPNMRFWFSCKFSVVGIHPAACAGANHSSPLHSIRLNIWTLFHVRIDTNWSVKCIASSFKN